MKNILFVCTGNICRSPGAEAVFRHVVEEAGRVNEFKIESAGTYGYHVGEPPDSRAIRAAQVRGISMEGMKARKVTVSDFKTFDLIVAMDQGHYDFLEALQPEDIRANLLLFMDFSDTKKGRSVPDPYYGGYEGFEDVFDMLEEGAKGILRHFT